jgi:hypothetical protein
MTDSDNELLIWKYLDGQASNEEKNHLLRKSEEDPGFKSYLDLLTQLEDNLNQPGVVRLSDAARQQILERAAKTGVPEKSVITGIPIFRGLKSFALLNVILLIAAILFFFLNLKHFEFGTDLKIVQDFYRTVENPALQSFFMLSIAFFGLLIFDAYLKKRSHGRSTTPV